MMTNRKHPPSTVDAALSQLSEDDRAEFWDWCKFKPSYLDMQRRLAELGQVVSVASLQRWYKSNFPIGEEAKAINALMSPYVGIDSQSGLQMSLAVSSKLLHLLLSQADSVKAAMLESDSLFHSLSVLVKEQRTASVKLHELTMIRDRQSLEFAGAYRLVEILKHMVKDAPQERDLLTYLEGAILKLEEEIGGYSG
jgi:hypothetical protein